MNTSPLDFEEWKHLMDAYPVLDVRSPAEYQHGHVPGAISMPLFSDRERAQIGKVYKSQGKRDAIKVGLDLVGPKMSYLVGQAESLGSPQLAMYCWRGGMRSDSLAWLLRRAGFEVHVLKGGYKAYRAALHIFFDQPLNLQVISGYTGSRKTDFLKMMEREGAQTINLEELACHQGSSYGNQKSQGQPTTEHFQNQIFAAFLNLDIRQPIWIEDECMRIGQVTLIESLHRQKETSPHFFIDIPKEDRIAFLVEDYGHLEDDKLVEATLNIRKRLGGLNTRRAIEFIHKNQLSEAVNIILEYYDKQYLNALERKKEYVAKHFKLRMKELPQLAKKLIQVPTHVV